ncbi:hypothetical protein [Lactiplantibacillus fabifermentans]|uniref:Uncharacterized protein n=2 Tax=Lactiplantibacillus fabifermentans TaxID=483011 RepID=A0A0R2NYZ6_9LACO|nr:hypothetical protein [Lactiplantibacillus fabifermentans]ETY72671.1 hypothetical protein LFAB_16530 [Lactiplantibacillus fabifermentans T30PCM01]KRO28042.1 hypothetical protein DY78_GL002719 [Lactiplantibacillus fabifermentans DSM 21115]
MSNDWFDEWRSNFKPLDIEHANEEELLHYRMLGMTEHDEERVLKRAKELGIWSEINKA